jgi:hypothetical protein
VGSKKLYFLFQRDILKLAIYAVKSKNELMFCPAIKNLPAIIERCEKINQETLKKHSE